MIVGGILLLVIGAILAFGVSFAVPYVAIPTVGAILMIGGAVLLIIGLVLATRRRGATTVERTSVDPATGNSVRSTSTDIDPDPR
jgi:hypothetical protein